MPHPSLESFLWRIHVRSVRVVTRTSTDGCRRSLEMFFLALALSAVAVICVAHATVLSPDVRSCLARQLEDAQNVVAAEPSPKILRVSVAPADLHGELFHLAADPALRVGQQLLDHQGARPHHRAEECLVCVCP